MQGHALGGCALLRGDLLIIPSVCDADTVSPWCSLSQSCRTPADTLVPGAPAPLWGLCGCWQGGQGAHPMGWGAQLGLGTLGTACALGKNQWARAGLDPSPCAAGAVPPPRCEGFQEQSELSGRSDELKGIRESSSFIPSSSFHFWFPQLVVWRMGCYPCPVTHWG